LMESVVRFVFLLPVCVWMVVGEVAKAAKRRRQIGMSRELASTRDE